ncbi:sigma-70 family RNA polymerase sigma factor [Streptomyces qaidamensis]|uniref:sigma-70 family RNA polymerase sigma factor n=1 Tax=Streptomyces qaidamensis TaxID=1783515 RepID=UPI0036637118
MDDDDRPPRHADALAALVKGQYDAMVRSAAKRLNTRDVPRSSADPEDVVQNALRAVLAHDKPIEKVPEYLYRCIANEVDRAASRHYSGLRYVSFDAEVQPEDVPTARPVDDAELRFVVNQALAGLTLQQRKALLLTRELGMTQAEAARVLGMATATLGVHAHRAIKALRLALVGVGAALVSWVAWSVAFGNREIVPGSNIEVRPVAYTVTMGVLLAVGVATATLGWWADGDDPSLPPVLEKPPSSAHGRELTFRGYGSGLFRWAAPEYLHMSREQQIAAAEALLEKESPDGGWPVSPGGAEEGRAVHGR